MTTSRCRVMFLIVAVLATLPVLAEDADAPKSSAPSSTEQSVVAQADPAATPTSATGRPQLAGTDLQRMLRRDASPARFTRRSDGVTVFDLNGGFRSVLVLSVDSKGKPEMACVASEEAAEANLSPRAAEVREP